mgnify:CR=1 FL=1
MYFDKFNLKTLICEPNSNNKPPNKTLKKLLFIILYKVYNPTLFKNGQKIEDNW